MASTKEATSTVEFAAVPFLGTSRRSTSPPGKSKQWLVIGCAALAFATLIINISLLAWAASKFKIENGTAIVHSGSLSEVKSISTWSHLGINILSTLLVGASNSCMQRLCAPTRTEVDAAHKEGRWLDIGILSFRNFRFISTGRIWLWLALAISTIPLHLLYNSVILEITTANDYVAAVVSSDFFSPNAPWNQTWWEAEGLIQLVNLSPIAQFKTDPSSLIRLENKECIEAYARYLVANSSTVFLLTNTTGKNDSMFQLTTYETLTQSSVSSSFSLFCPGQKYIEGLCNLDVALAASSDWTTTGFVYDSSLDLNLQIESCMVEPTTASSSIGINTSALIVVIVCNFIKFVCFLIAVKAISGRSLITIGDAIVSFLEDPDTTTKNYSTLSKQDVTAGRWKPGISGSGESASPLPWSGKRHFWFRAASVRRWLLCSAIALAILVAGLILLLLGMHSVGGEESPSAGYTIPMSTLTRMGFGAIGQNNQLDFNTPPSLASALFIANLPQLAVTGLYFMYNGIFTCMLTSKEWTSFADGRRRLRVSEPAKGTRQRGTMYLQLPYQYILPIMAASAAVHWLLSQSIFVVQVHIRGLEDFNFDPTRTFTGVEWSPLPIISVLAVGGAMIVALWLLGFRKYNGKIPLVGSCSLAISAACRRREDDEDVTENDIIWGALGVDKDGASFAGFSSGAVGPLVQGETYH